MQKFNLAWRIVFAAAILGAALTSRTAAAEKAGILVMAHGGDQPWNDAIESVMAPLRKKQPVEIAFGMAEPSSLEQAVRRLEEAGVRRIAVVRMFVSGESFLETTEAILGLRACPPASHQLQPGPADEPATHHHAEPSAQHHTKPAGHHHDQPAGDHHAEPAGHHQMEAPRPIRSQSAFVLSREGVADSTLLDQVLVDRVKALSIEPRRERVLLIAHGPGDDAENERWLAKMRLRVQRIYEIGPFRHIECETLREDWPERRQDSEARIRRYVQEGSRDGGRVIVIPFRVVGFGPYAEVLKGLDYAADGRGFCPHPNMTRWIEQTASECWQPTHASGK